MKTEIIKYYDALADTYDTDRFSNSYGDYIHHQELRVLHKYLSKDSIHENLDLACGTGRFLDFADYGMDISSEMVRVSQKKFPDKKITVGDAEGSGFEDEYFENVISLHLFMHLDLKSFKSIQKEVARISKPSAQFIFDIPSERRRRLFGYKAPSWHGGNQISYRTLKKEIKEDWEIVNFHGIAFFPIHRIPKRMRKFFVSLDSFLCNSIFKEYSSHLIFILKKND